MSRRVWPEGFVAVADLHDLRIDRPLQHALADIIGIARRDDLASLIAGGGNVINGGTSSVVSRFILFAAKTNGWKARYRIRRSGASAVRLQRMG